MPAFYDFIREFWNHARMAQPLEKTFSKHTIAGFLVCLLFCFASFSSFANDNVHQDKYAAFVMDADTGTVLHRENANKRLHPASLTKIMTLLMVFEALDQRKLKLYDRVLITSHAASMIPSKLDLPAGSTIKVRDAIRALSVKSANDVAVAVAEKLGGSEARFAKMMTKKARSLGMTRTRFMNASGLHHPRQVSTARDMAKLARVLLTDYQKHYHYFSRDQFKYRGKTYKSHNKLMKTYPGMDGFKTGYIRASGFNLVSSAVRGDNRLIGVVFGGKTGNLRNDQMEMILDRSFARVGTMMMARVPLPERKPVRDIQVADASGFTYVSPAAGHVKSPAKEIQAYARNAKASRWDMLSAVDETSLFNRLVGQGDYDMAMRNRIETGLIGVSAVLNEPIPAHVWKDGAAVVTKARTKGNWAVQVGAFSSRERTDKALTHSLAALPNDLRYGQGTVAPLQTEDGWIFRARLHGYTKRAAYKACKALDDCIPIAPYALNR